MAQGSAKLSRAKKSGGSQKRKAVAKKKASKGWKQHNAKGRKVEHAKREAEATKAINRRNEAIVSAKAIGSGTTFFLNDIKQVGTRELKNQERERSKKEKNEVKMSDRLKAQLQKLEGDA